MKTLPYLVLHSNALRNNPLNPQHRISAEMCILIHLLGQEETLSLQDALVCLKLLIEFQETNAMARMKTPQEALKRFRREALQDPQRFSQDNLIKGLQKGHRVPLQPNPTQTKRLADLVTLIKLSGLRHLTAQERKITRLKTQLTQP